MALDTPRCPAAIIDTSMLWASAFADRPMGARKSAANTSPGCTGASRSMVVEDFDVMGPSFFQTKQMRYRSPNRIERVSARVPSLTHSTATASSPPGPNSVRRTPAHRVAIVARTNGATMATAPRGGDLVTWAQRSGVFRIWHHKVPRSGGGSPPRGSAMGRLGEGWRGGVALRAGVFCVWHHKVPRSGAGSVRGSARSRLDPSTGRIIGLLARTGAHPRGSALGRLVQGGAWSGGRSGGFSPYRAAAWASALNSATISAFSASHALKAR